MISPENCGKFRQEVRDWKTFNKKKVALRCKDPLNCDFCRKIDAIPYRKPILDKKKNNEPVFSFIVTRNNWDRARKHLQRAKSTGYSKFPISETEYVVFSDILPPDVPVVDNPNLEEIIAQVHVLNAMETEYNPRRASVGSFKIQEGEEDESDTVLVLWPEPRFMNVNTGELVSDTYISRLINDFLRLLSPLTEITPENVNHYAMHKARLKAFMVESLNPELKLIGFDQREKEVPVETIKRWEIIPINNPEDSVLNTAFGKTMVDAIFFGKVPTYDSVDWNVRDWSDYKSEEEIAFIELTKGVGHE